MIEFPLRLWSGWLSLRRLNMSAFLLSPSLDFWLARISINKRYKDNRGEADMWGNRRRGGGVMKVSKEKRAETKQRWEEGQDEEDTEIREVNWEKRERGAVIERRGYWTWQCGGEKDGEWRWGRKEKEGVNYEQDSERRVEVEVANEATLKQEIKRSLPDKEEEWLRSSRRVEYHESCFRWTWSGSLSSSTVGRMDTVMEEEVGHWSNGLSDGRLFID